MARYVTERPVTGEWWNPQPAPALPHPQVFVSDPVDTGLLDPAGRKIMRLPDEIGFIRSNRKQ